MPINDEQAKQIKEQILKQIEGYPSDKKEQIKKYILSMTNQELEEFLAKNQARQEAGGEEGSGEGEAEKGKSQCVMCMLANKQMEALALYEDKDYLGVLEIKPFSKGHAILVPKKHVKDTKSLKAKAFTIANRLGKHIVSRLGAENFQITTSDELGHAIINIIPVYKDQPMEFKRTPADKAELQEISMKIGAVKKREKVQKIKTDKTEKKKDMKSEEKSKSNVIRLPRRIP